MQLINPFKNKEPSQEEMMNKQFKNERDITLMHNTLQDHDYDTLLNKENQLAELTRWQQDLSPMLQQLFCNLCGLTEDDEGNLVKIENYEAVCNHIAAKRWVDFIRPLDKNVMNGAWTIQQINDALIWIDDTIAQDLIEHYKVYEVEYSIAIFDYICNSIINAIQPTFLRGLENGERKYHGQIQKLIETKNLNPEKRQKGLFGKE